MVKKNPHGIIIETPTEARQAERGPSILIVLTVSVIVAMIAMAVIWFVFFQT
jgi:flagellar basal body-associated protein FliL